MKRLFLVLGTAIMVLPWLTVARVQADMIQWTATGGLVGPYVNPSNRTQIIPSLQTGTAGMNMESLGDTTKGTNSGSVMLATTNAYISEDSPNGPLTIGGSRAKYSLSLELHDLASGASGSLTFSGVLSGWLTAAQVDVTNTFLGPTTQTLTLGKNLYTVTIGPFVPSTGIAIVGNPGSIVKDGTISASISVQPAVNSAPEPSSLLLACLGLPPLGLARWFRRRKAVGSDARNA